jgi:molecular chaperone GrpE
MRCFGFLNLRKRSMRKKDSEKNIENNPFIEENIEETADLQPEAQDDEKEKLKAELEELKSQYIRMAADFDNYRKRQMQERESLLKYGAEDTLKKFLQVVDTFDRAKNSLQDVNDCEQVKESIDVIYKQFLEALEKSGVKKIETVGKEFDHNLHEAVMQTPTDKYPNHTIISEMQGGYMLEDRVLRAALVNVAVNE